MRGKLIVIEGTDCSGKETQTNILLEKLGNMKIEVEKFSYPNYNSPTGKIVGGPYLGKKHISDGWFKEGAGNVDPKIASLYYAADRKYNINVINQLLESGKNIILDRYVYSNMAHQGGKIPLEDKRREMYKWVEQLEFDLLDLPKADIRVFLHMPYENALELKKNRIEAPDQHEQNEEHLKMAENAYVEIADTYDFKTIKCNNKDSIKSIEQISEELVDYILEELML